MIMMNMENRPKYERGTSLSKGANYKKYKYKKKNVKILHVMR
jgi:hypothetical protein